MRRFLPELIALPILPLLIAQGRHTRRVTPRLPEVPGPDTGLAGQGHDGAALSLLTVGESPVAGVGVENHDEAITGQLALQMAHRLQRPVSWRACGKNGITVREARIEVIPHIPCEPVDVALVAFGVNDTTAFRPVSRWSADLRQMLDAIESRCQPKLILLSGVPPIARFPALPQPLRWVMGLKAQALDVAACEIATKRAHTCHVPLMLDTADRAMMAADGYHPSAKGCTAWARLLVEAAAPEIEKAVRP